jgi:hypothetical protein
MSHLKNTIKVQYTAGQGNTNSAGDRVVTRRRSIVITIFLQSPEGVFERSTFGMATRKETEQPT